MNQRQAFMQEIEASMKGMELSGPVKKILRQIARQVHGGLQKDLKESQKALRILNEQSEEVVQSFIRGFRPSKTELKKPRTKRIWAAVRSLSITTKSDAVKKHTRSTP